MREFSAKVPGSGERQPPEIIRTIRGSQCKSFDGRLAPAVHGRISAATESQVGGNESWHDGGGGESW